MNRDTPLAEVVEHLPAEVALKLLDLTPQTRLIILRQIRYGVEVAEKEGAMLDPISYRAVVYAIAVMALAMAELPEGAQRGVRG